MWSTIFQWVLDLCDEHIPRMALAGDDLAALFKEKRNAAPVTVDDLLVRWRRAFSDLIGGEA